MLDESAPVQSDVPASIDAPAAEPEGPSDLSEARSGFRASLDEEPARAPEPSAGADEQAAARSGVDRGHDERALRHAAEQIAHERYGPIVETFGRLDDDTAEALVHLAGMYAVNPERAAMELARSFGFDVGDPDAAPMTREELRAEIAAMAAMEADQAAVAAAVESARGDIRSTAQGLGFDLESDAYAELLIEATKNYRHLPPVDAVRAAAQKLAPARAANDDGPVTLQDAARLFRAAL